MKIRQRLATAVAAAMLFLPVLASAAGYGGIGGRPANPQPNNPRTQSIFIYELKPGQSAADGIQVFNNTDQRQTVSLYAVDSVLSSGGAFACAQNADPKHDVGAWVELSSDTINLGPNSNQVVPFTVTVPDSRKVSVGEHDGCIALQAASQTATATNRNGVVLSFRSAIRMVVTIPGKIVKRLDIKTVAISRAKDGNYLVTPTIQNSGNVSLDTNVQVKLVTLFGNSLVTSKAGTSPVLPRTQASQNFEIKRPFWGGLYRAKVIAAYNSNPATELGLGQHSNQQTIQRNSAIFFAMPAAAAAPIELVILLLIAGAIFWIVKRWRSSKHIRHHWEAYSVKRGDTLEKLSKRFNVSWKKIATANKLKPPYNLKQGQELKLPPKAKTKAKTSPQKKTKPKPKTKASRSKKS